MNRVLTSFNPWREIDRLQEEMNRLFSNRRRSGWFGRAEFPPVNVWRDEHNIVLTAEVPGVEPDDLDLTVTGETVTIRGRRQPRELKEGEAWHRQERRVDAFTRSIELPFEVDSARAEATLEKGVLTLRLQRPETQKPKKVAVKAG